MSRLARHRLGWLLAVLALAAAAVALLRWTGARPLAMLLVALVLLLPGRVQGALWREFFRGTRLLRAGRPAEAIPHLERFRGEIAARPALKRAIWLSWPGYSPDVEAMTRTNLGAARLQLGEYDAAERELRAAIAIDARSPLPWLNLGYLHAARHEGALAERAFAEARRLGWRGNVVDRAQDAASGALASLEGRGG